MGPPIHSASFFLLDKFSLLDQYFSVLIKRERNTANPYSRLPISKAAAAACQSLPMAIVAAAFVLFFANGTNIVANWVKKRHKVKEDSSNIFKIANIGKHRQKESQLRNRIKWNKFYIVLKWQRLAKCGTSKLQPKAA